LRGTITRSWPCWASERSGERRMRRSGSPVSLGATGPTATAGAGGSIHSGSSPAVRTEQTVRREGAGSREDAEARR
jgi:hypothetical protein